MTNSPPNPKVAKLQEHLLQLKDVYEDRLRKGKDHIFLRPIEKQIDELERAIRQFLNEK